MLEEPEERIAAEEEVAEEEEEVEELKIEELKVLLNVIKTWRKVLAGEAPPAVLEEIASSRKLARKRAAGGSEGEKAKKAKAKKGSSKKSGAKSKKKAKK